MKIIPLSLFLLFKGSVKIFCAMEGNFSGIKLRDE
jgi:hypothetical protein